MRDSYRPSPDSLRAPHCVRDLQFLFFFYLNHLQVRLCFLSSDIFAVAEVCLDPSVGVDECVDVGVALQMSILISWLDGLTDC